LAAALITASFQLGSAHGLAVFSGIATSPTSHLLAAHTPPPEALTAGIQRARGRPQNTELCVINDATETDAKACRSKTSFASNGSRVFLVVRGTVFFVVRRRGRRVGTGPGVACPKSRRSGASRPRWRQSRSPVAPRTACRGAGGVGLQVPADAAADLAFQCSQFLFRCLALGDFLVVAGAAIAGPVADLGDRGHVDGVVQAPVPA
jgi:hypothetical protein